MHTRIDADFATLLGPRFRLEELERYPGSVFGLWPDSRLAYVNPAWTTFADANGGQPGVEDDWGIGSRYLDAIPPPLRQFYERLLQSAPDPGTSLHPVSHRYECSSAAVARQFNMQVYSLSARAGFVIVNSLLFEEAAAFRGASRATMDVDLVIAPTAAALDDFVQRMGALGLSVSADAARERSRIGACSTWSIPRRAGRRT